MGGVSEPDDAARRLAECLRPDDPVGFICARVARAHGQSYHAVLREPYAWTLEAFCQLLTQERIERAGARLDAVGDAHLAALAFSEPQRLAAERDRVLDALGAGTPPEAFTAAVADMIAATAKLDAAMASETSPEATDG